MAAPEPTPASEEARRVVALCGSAGSVPLVLQEVAALDFLGHSALFVMYHRLGDHPFDLGRFVHGCRFTVAPAVDGEPVRANHVYHTPDTADVTVEGGRIRVRPSQGRPHPSIDRLLVSLAREYGRRATAFLLSGMGSDGVAGLAAVRAAGGATFVQDPGWAEYDRLPAAALAKPGHRALTTPELMAQVRDALRGDGEGAPAERAAA